MENGKWKMENVEPPRAPRLTPHALHPSLLRELRTWALFTAFASFSYVAGFLIIFVPSGLGVREYFLTLFLVPEIHILGQMEMGEARGKAVLTVLLLRLVWTAAEVAAVGVLYWLPIRK